jgi:hypothetical protein
MMDKLYRANLAGYKDECAQPAARSVTEHSADDPSYLIRKAP